MLTGVRQKNGFPLVLFNDALKSSRTRIREKVNISVFADNIAPLAEDENSFKILAIT